MNLDFEINIGVVEDDEILECIEEMEYSEGMWKEDDSNEQLSIHQQHLNTINRGSYQGGFKGYEQRPRKGSVRDKNRKANKAAKAARRKK